MKPFNLSQHYQRPETRPIADVSRFVQLAGGAWPFQDLVGEHTTFGTASAPLVPIVSPPDGFCTPILTEGYFGAGHVGGIQLALDMMQVRGAPAAAPAPTNRNYVGRQAFVSATASDGGTGTTSNTGKGGLFAQGALAVLYSGATNWLNITASEFNVQASAGSSLAYKAGVQIVAMPGDAVQGATYDAALSLSNQGGAVGFRHGVLFSGANGSHPVKSNGTMLGLTDAPTINCGIDLRGATFTANPFISAGFSVDNVGNAVANGYFSTTPNAVIRIGAPSTASSPALQFRSSGNAAPTYDSAIIGFGGSATVGAGGINVQASLFQSAVDNGCQLGGASGRWTVVFAATGTINTSDERGKTVLGRLDDARFAAVLDAIGEVPLLAFQANDAIAAKGSGARIHAGIGAQTLHAAFAARGLDPFAWGVLCRDPVMEWFDEPYEAERPKRAVSTIEEEVCEIVAGKLTKRRTRREIEHDAVQEMPLFNEDGSPALGVNGEQIMGFAPVMERTTATRRVQRPKLEADGTPAVIWGVRYEEFLVLRQAWLERETKRITP